MACFTCVKSKPQNFAVQVSTLFEFRFVVFIVSSGLVPHCGAMQLKISHTQTYVTQNLWFSLCDVLQLKLQYRIKKMKKIFRAVISKSWSSGTCVLHVLEVSLHLHT